MTMITRSSTSPSSSPLTVKEQFEASATNFFWSTMKNLKTPTDGDDNTVDDVDNNTAGGRGRAGGPSQSSRRPAGKHNSSRSVSLTPGGGSHSVLSTSSHDDATSSVDNDDDDEVSSDSIRAPPNDHSPHQVLFQSVLRAVFSSCTTGAPYKIPTSTTPQARQHRHTTAKNAGSSGSRSHYSSWSASTGTSSDDGHGSGSRGGSGTADRGSVDHDTNGSPAGHKFNHDTGNLTRVSKMTELVHDAFHDSAAPVSSTSDTTTSSRGKQIMTTTVGNKLDAATTESENLRSVQVVQSTGRKLTSVTKTLFASDAAAAQEAVTRLREKQAVDQEKRRLSLMELKQRRQEYQLQQSIVHSTATSAATASSHGREDLTFQRYLMSAAGVKSAVERPSSFFPASNPVNRSTKNGNMTTATMVIVDQNTSQNGQSPPGEAMSPPRKANGKAYPTISCSSFDIDDDGVSTITQETIDVLVKKTDTANPTVSYLNRVYSDSTDPIDGPFAEWEKAFDMEENAKAVGSLPSMPQAGRKVLQSMSPPRFSLETRSTDTHSFFTRTSHSTQTEDVHSAWKKGEQEYWSSLVATEGREVSAHTRRSREIVSGRIDPSNEHRADQTNLKSKFPTSLRMNKLMRLRIKNKCCPTKETTSMTVDSSMTPTFSQTIFQSAIDDEMDDFLMMGDGLTGFAEI